MMSDSNTEIISFNGGNGSSIFDAVEIAGAQTFFSGIHAEVEFIMNNCGENNVECIDGETIVFQNVVFHKISIVKTNNEIMKIFFNATGFHHYIEKEEIDVVKNFMQIS